MQAWLIKCESKREFVVYADTGLEASRHFAKMMPTETESTISVHNLDHTLAAVDNRVAPGQ